MKEIITLIALVIVFVFVYMGFLSTTDDTPVNEPKTISNTYRMGPILLKIGDEWFFEGNNKKYIRIGLLKTAWGSTAGSEYPNLSPDALSIKSSEVTIINEKAIRNKELEINTYDIECKSNTLWIDINAILHNQIVNDSKNIKILIHDVKDFYIYHPVENKWFGPEKYDSDFEKILYSELFNETNTTEDVKELLSKYRINREEIVASIINKRTLVIPSLKYYNDVLYGITVPQKGRTALYEWYSEKKEIKPKDEDE